MQELASFDGDYFRLDNAVNSPKPVQKPHPPIWLGLNTRATVMPRVAAEHAQGIVIEWGDDEIAAVVVPRLSEACEALGRDPAEMAKARHLGVVFTDGAADKETVYRELARRSGIYNPDLLRETWDTWLGAFVGTPDEVREQLPDRALELRFTHAMFHVLSLGFEDQAGGLRGLPGSTFAGMRLMASAVMPAFR